MDKYFTYTVDAQPGDHFPRIFSGLRIWLKGRLVNPEIQVYKCGNLQDLGQIRKKGKN